MQSQAQTYAQPGQPVNLQVHVNLPPSHHGRRHEQAHEEVHGRRARVFFCDTCGERTRPIPYFSRGLNVAKAAALFPLTAFGPLVLFLFRKDRVVCANCHALLPGNLHVPLLESFSSEPESFKSGALVRRGEDAMIERQVVSQEIEHLERRSRKRKGKAWTYGIAAGMLASAGATTIAEGPSPVFFGLSALSAAGAFRNGRRGQRESLEAEAKRQRQRVLEILELARAHQGRLTVTLVASHMHLDFREAEAVLDSMVDGRRVDVHVDDEGRMSYVFPELM